MMTINLIEYQIYPRTTGPGTKRKLLLLAMNEPGADKWKSVNASSSVLPLSNLTLLDKRNIHVPRCLVVKLPSVARSTNSGLVGTDRSNQPSLNRPREQKTSFF